MPSFADRVEDTTTTTGLGDITLAGSPPTGRVAFASVFTVAGPRFPYALETSDESEWEVGYGCLTSALVLQRCEVLASSNSGALVSFSSGTKNVYSPMVSDVAKRVVSRGVAYALARGLFAR